MEFLVSAKFLKISITAAVLFIFLDFLWLAVIASAWYRQALGYLANLDPQGKIIFNIPMGLLAQVVISVALSAVIMLALSIDNRLTVAIGWGAFIGLALYATYDFTNLSFVKGWPLWISLADVVWGTLQGGMAGTYVYYLNRYVN
jgi:uncharacterized membrane protein